AGIFGRQGPHQRVHVRRRRASQEISRPIARHRATVAAGASSAPTPVLCPDCDATCVSGFFPATFRVRPDGCALSIEEELEWTDRLPSARGGAPPNLVTPRALFLTVTKGSRSNRLA